MKSTTMRYECHGISDRGQVRSRNEDHFLLADLTKSLTLRQSNLAEADQTGISQGERGLLAMVADGMGGHRGGREASALAIRAVRHYIVSTMPWFFTCETEGDVHEALQRFAEAVRSAEAVTSKQAAEHPVLEQMGTTATVGCFVRDRLFLAHAGDSRCYLSREGALKQLTKDHTVAQQLVDAGVLSTEDAQSSPHSNILVNAISGSSDNPPVKPEVHCETVQAADTVLFCSDGLTRHVSDTELLSHLGEPSSSAEASCSALIDLANSRGGEDNVTVVIVRAYN